MYKYKLKSFYRKSVAQQNLTWIRRYDYANKINNVNKFDTYFAYIIDEENVQELHMLNVFLKGNISLFLSKKNCKIYTLNYQLVFMNPKVNLIKFYTYSHRLLSLRNIEQISNYFIGPVRRYDKIHNF